MSDVSELPPNIQERLLRMQQLQRNLQTILAQKQQVEHEATETEQALTELGTLTPEAIIYKSIGALLVKSEKGKVEAELKERKELLTTRTQVLGKQEERFRAQLNELQAKLKRDLASSSPTPSTF